MLGFTLSKMNLLILVTALFSIIAFFMFSFTDIAVARGAQQMVDNYLQSVAGVVSNQTLCFTSPITVPETIEYSGGIQQSKRYYYVMYLKRNPENYDPERLSTLIMQIANRKEQDKIIAATKIDLNAEILLYDWDPSTFNVVSQPSFKLDPLSEGVPKNSIVLIKETYMGKNYLHVIACSSAPAVCQQNLQKAACLIKSGRPKGSICFPECEE
ncbi:MAG: hypothetical protein NTW59_01600 [Candidatus Diapherotrites archaeon]|nr:hypothetical protein [Candidatus Diapherotrites archaeon]